jgi:hypothetical protein
MPTFSAEPAFDLLAEAFDVPFARAEAPYALRARDPPTDRAIAG